MEKTSLGWRGLVASIAAVAAVAATGTAYAASAWTLVDIDALANASTSFGEDVSNSGIAVGVTRIEGPLGTDSVAFWYRQGVVGSFGSTSATANGVNGSGVGTGQTESGNAAIFRDGEVISLGFQGAGRAINESGGVVGERLTGTGAHAFLYVRGTLVELGTLGGAESYATDINAGGDIVGYSTLVDGTTHAFLYRDGTMWDLGPGSALAINDRGVVVGTSGGVAFVYDGERRDLPPLYTATDINNLGQIVGLAYDGRGVLLDRGELTLLASLESVAARSWRYLAPAAINDRGWIVGTVSEDVATPQAFLLIPALATTLSANPAAIDFEGQSVGTTSPARAVTVTNTGGSSITFTDSALSTGFEGASDCTTLAPGASCSVTIAFAPDRVGTISGFLVLHSSAGLLEVEVVGVGEGSHVAPNAPGVLSGLWWNPDESGWGIHLTQRANTIFAVWFTYDPMGSPHWYFASNCAISPALPCPTCVENASCSGELFEASGSRFFGAPFNPEAVQRRKVGTVQLDFRGAGNATMSYVVGERSRAVQIERQVFQAGSTPPAIDYTDLWWKPDESGWGLGISQQFGMMFLAWFVYEDSGDGFWYVASACAVKSDGNGCTGTLYRTTGPSGPLASTTFDPAQVNRIAVGTIDASFTDANNGTITYNVDGVQEFKAITRQLF